MAFMNVKAEDLKGLPLLDRLRLVGDLWDSIGEELDRVPLAPDLIVEMKRRRAAWLDNPSSGMDWEELRRRLECRK